MPIPAAAHDPPAPAPGSARFFALLYTPPALRRAMSRLLAVADEIDAGAARQLDPSIAGARLDWWRLEAARFAARTPQHPWLQAQLSDPELRAQPDLRPLVEAATQPGGAALRSALFVAAAELLGAVRDQADRDALAQLGAQSWQHEQAVHAGASAARGGAPAAAAVPAAPALLASVQSRIAPLLVWAALSCRAGPGRPRLQMLLDNLRAWQVARRAAAGRYIRT